MLEDLRGKAVLVTGASSGIGAAVAGGFGRYGARVAVHYHRNEEAAEPWPRGRGRRAARRSRSEATLPARPTWSGSSRAPSPPSAGWMS
jgi:NAD(P)-dependent dehydrogenase (short-subunit alcohol dehydrogenase family)